MGHAHKLWRAATTELGVELGVDEDAQGDIAFWLWSTTAYCAVRIATELMLPGKHKGYTYQQYIVTLFHQACLLPLLGLGWSLGWWRREGSSLIYLLTGAYMISDSIVNYSPVSGCVTSPTSKPHFSWAVHTHHIFTFVLCGLGTTLPPWAEDEGAVAVLLGEAGSLWITITQLWPTNVNFLLRFYLFLFTRLCGVAIAADMLRQIDSTPVQLLFVAMCLGVSHQNWKTLGRMRDNAKASKEKEPPGSPSKNWPL